MPDDYLTLKEAYRLLRNIESNLDRFADLLEHYGEYEHVDVPLIGEKVRYIIDTLTQAPGEGQMSIIEFHRSFAQKAGILAEQIVDAGDPPKRPQPEPVPAPESPQEPAGAPETATEASSEPSAPTEPQNGAGSKRIKVSRAQREMLTTAVRLGKYEMKEAGLQLGNMQKVAKALVAKGLAEYVSSANHGDIKPTETGRDLIVGSLSE